MSAASPMLAAWELGVRLREARESAGITGVEAARTVGMSQNHVSNIERGRRTIAADKLHELTQAYGTDDDERQALVDLRNACDGRGWWHRYRALLSPEFIRFIGCEHGAATVKTYESALVSGLLQTENYTRAVHVGDGANLRKSDVDRRVAVRQNRKHKILGDDPLRAQVVMSESVLHQQIGDHVILAEQIEHILDLMVSHQDNLDIRILPFTAPACAAMGGSTFHVFTFPSARLPKIAWEETAVSMGLVDDQSRVHQYNAIFAEVHNTALDQQASYDLIRAKINQLRASTQGSEASTH